jgi:hypothetical protein
MATSALSQTILIIGIPKIPPEGRRLAQLPSIVITTGETTGPKEPALVRELAPPQAAWLAY